MDRAGLITLEQAQAAGLSFVEPEPRACPHCGAALEPLGAALAGKVAWVSAAPCPCEGAAREREFEERRRASLAAKEEAARREKALSRAGIPRRYWAAEADRPEFAEYIASFAGNGAPDSTYTGASAPTRLTQPPPWPGCSPRPATRSPSRRPRACSSA